MDSPPVLKHPENERFQVSVGPPLFDVAAVVRIFWARRLTIGASVLVTLLMALLFLLVTKPTYTATASILIDPRDARSMQFQDVLPGIGADSAAIASQVFVIQSRDLLMAVFEKERGAADDEFAGGGLLSFLTADHSPREAAFSRFERRVSVDRAGLTYVIEVRFKSESATKAARIANAIVERYRAGLAGEREGANAAANDRLLERAGPLQSNVTAAEQAVRDFKLRHDILDPEAGGTLQSRIDQLTAQALAAHAAADQSRDRYEQAASAGTAADGLARRADILSSVAMDGLRSDYNTRAAALANAETIYQPRHPTIRRLRSELERTGGLLNAEAARVTRELKAKSDLSAKGAAALDLQLAALRERSQAVEDAQVELRRLEAKAQAARTVLDDVLKRTEETGQMRGLQPSEARIIGFAAPPVRPSWPLPLLIVPASAALGLMLGCGIAALQGARRMAPRGEKTIDQSVAAPRKVEPVDLGDYALPGSVAAGTASRMRTMRRQFLSHGGEAFSQRTLRLVRRISDLLTEHAMPYRLLVTSRAGPEDAKLAAAMIGIGLQKAGQSVLVVEIAERSLVGAPVAGEGAGVFVDGASGLPMIVHSSGDGGMKLDEDMIAAFDFVLVVVAPSRTADEAFLRDLAADLLLVACRAGEAPNLAETWIGRSAGDWATCCAIMTISCEEAAVSDTLGARVR